MKSSIRDLIHAARSLRKDRGFTLICVLSLGIGMGGLVALATFTRMITAPARVIDTDGVVELLVLPSGPLREKAGEWALERWSYPDYQELRRADAGLSVSGWALETSETGEPAPDEKAPPRTATLYVSTNYFNTFGVPLALGAGFDPAIDDTASAAPRVVLSHDFWSSRLGSDPAVVGKPLKVDGVSHVIVGVAPPEFRGHFHFFQSPDSIVFLPLERHPRLREKPNAREDRATDWVRIHGRLHDGVDLARANAMVSAVATTLAQQHPDTNEFKAATVEPYASMGARGRPESRRVTSVILGLAGTVLVIVCLNISGMMLVRGANRERELSIRAALGASRRSLVLHLFLEAVLLAFAGGALSAFVLFGIPAVAAWYFGVPVPPEMDFDATGVAISTGLCLFVSVLFGLLPAMRFSRPNLISAMKENTGGGARQTIRVHRVAAMVQIGMSIPFLVVSGVMLDRVRTAEFGFATEGIAAARLPAVPASEQDPGFAIRRVRDNLRQAGGVRSVAVAAGMPIDFQYRLFRVAGMSEERFVTAHLTRVGENFLETIGATLLRGRTITAEDRIMAEPVAVISEPLAALLFPSSEPIGERVKITMAEGQIEEFTVVGVTADFATSQLTTERPQILVPLPDAAVEAPSVFVIARGAPGDEPKLKAALEKELRDLGVKPQPGVAFSGIVTGQDLVEKSLSDLVSESIAVGVAGAIVLVLAALGIVGVVGFMVATRTREIAVRMALGSSRLRVFRLMLSGIVKLAIPGVIGGLLLASVLIRTMEDVMGTPLTVGPTPLGAMEAVVYAVASGIAVTAALLAGLPAARRATSVQPMVAMRSE
jgi:predicted permease